MPNNPVLNALRRKLIAYQGAGLTDLVEAVKARIAELESEESYVNVSAADLDFTPPTLAALVEETSEPEDELAELRARAEAAGVKVDGRWGVDRLRAELDAIEE